jgi:signal transduction histidine kinase
VGNHTDPDEVCRLRIEIAALNELLEVEEQVVSDQSVKLEQARRELDQRIQQLKLTEKQMQRYAADLERANEEVKQFAYIVSHDLRAPLINLKGFTAELRSALEVLEGPMTSALPQLSEEQRQQATEALRQDIPEALDFIDSSATRMDNFVSAILKLSRIGRRELKFESVNPTEIVESVLKGLAHQIAAREVKVTVGPLPEVSADRTALEQIMGNILSNPVNYLEPSRAGEIEITGEKDEIEARFFIRDNGRGIAKEDMDKVFAPFRRAGKQDIKGEGMGMAYVQTMVRRHGGYIRCESELDVGTTFIVTLSNHPEPRGEYGKPDGA